MRGLSLVLLASACGSDVFLDSQWAGMSTAIIVVEGVQPRVQAFRLPGPIRLQADRDASLTAMLYDKTLEDLGLDEGPIATVDLDVCGAKRLPTPSIIQQAEADGGAWVALEEAPQLISELRVAGRCPCVPLRVETIQSIAPDGFGRSVLVPDRGLFFYLEERAVRVERTGITTVDQSSIPSLLATVYGPGGEVWAASERGRLFRRPVDGPWTETATSPSRDTLWNLDGSGVGDPVDVVVMSDDGELLRFDGQAWSELFSEARPASGGKQKANVAWMSAEEIYATQPDRAGILEWDGQRITIVESSAVTVMRRVGDRVVAGTFEGKFIERQGGWVSLGSEMYAPINGIVDSGDGFFFTAQDTQLGRYVDGFGFCAERFEVPRIELLYGLHLLEGRPVIVGFTGEEMVAVFFTER